MTQLLHALWRDKKIKKKVLKIPLNISVRKLINKKLIALLYYLQNYTIFHVARNFRVI